jgi:hypothetical protein
MEKMIVKSNDIVRDVYILDGRSGCCSDDPLVPEQSHRISWWREVRR